MATAKKSENQPDVPGENEARHGLEEVDRTRIDAAIADHFEIPIESLTGFVLAAEHTNENGMTLSAAWSTITPKWTLIGFVTQLGKQIEEAVG